jgi:membrane protease YdiL (CAAX protease family)
VRFDRRKLAGWVTLVGALSILGYANRAAEGTPPSDLLYRYSTAVSAVVQYGIILAVVLAIAGQKRKQLLGLRQPSSYGRAVGFGVLALVITYTAAGIVQAVADPEKEQGLTPDKWDPSRAGPYAANFVAIALIAPVVEELTFRGLGYSLLAPLGQTTAVLWVGIAFGLSHGLLTALPILIVFGCGLALIRARTDSVYPGIVVHAAFNTATLVAVILS